MRLFWCVLALFGLMGCEQVSERVTDGLSQISSGPDETAAGIRTLSLLDGSVRVRGADGYCVDQGASDARRGFAVLAGCALLSDEAAVMPQLDGLITVQFGAPDTASVNGNEPQFAAFLETESGAGLLSSVGDAAGISDVAVVSDRSGVMVHFTDAAGSGIEETTGEQWRGFVDVRGRLTTVTVHEFARNEMTRTQGERLLVVAMAQLLEVNADAVPVQ